MGILSENFDEILIITVNDVISQINLFGFQSSAQREFIRDNLGVENINTVINYDQFIEKYCIKYGQEAELELHQEKNLIIIKLFRRLYSGLKTKAGHIYLFTKEPSIIDLFKGWPNFEIFKNKNILWENL